MILDKMFSKHTASYNTILVINEPSSNGNLTVSNVQCLILLEES
jgi:hypothetical protein